MIERPKALFTLAIIFSGALVFHFFVLAGVIPFEIVWGGRITEASQMIVFEAISISINSLFLWATLIERGFFNYKFPARFSKIIFIVMGLIFALNTAGNLLSLNTFEKSFFTILTAVISILCLSIGITTPVDKKFPD